MDCSEPSLSITFTVAQAALQWPLNRRTRSYMAELLLLNKQQQKRLMIRVSICLFQCLRITWPKTASLLVAIVTGVQ